MSMTKIDYELIAHTLYAEVGRWNGDDTPERYYRITCEVLATALATTNPKFDRARFLAGCGINNDKEQLK